VNWKGFGRSGHGLILRCYPGILLKGLKEMMKNLSQDSWYPGYDLGLGSLKYEAGVLTTPP
jgi:hypothetical protein